MPGDVHYQFLSYSRRGLAAAIARPDKPAGGVIVVAGAQDAPAVRAGARALGLEERLWDNGTIAGQPA